MLSETSSRQIRTLMDRYPRKRSALIPALQLVQQEFGALSPETIEEVARLFGMAPAEVDEVAGFYTMLHRKPVGRYVIQVCTNLSCMLCEAETIKARLIARLGIQPGETTEDRRFTLLEAECLGACGTSPVIQINGEFHEELTPEKLDGILDGLE